MATQQTSDSPRATDLQIVRLLATAAKADTVYRDLYLQRAAARLSALLSRTEYEQLRGQNAAIDNLLAQTRRAVDRQDWTQVQELTARATGLRRLLETKHGEMELANDIYDAADVAIDPLSPGFDTLFAAGGRGAAGVREELNATLTALVQADPAWSDLYAQRQAYFAGLSLLPESHMQQGAGDSPNELQQQLQQAAEKGDLELLHRLSGEMLKISANPSEQTTGGSRQTPTLQRSASSSAALAKPFPASAIEPARALGFAHVEIKSPFPTLQKTLTEFLDWYTWHPSFPVTELAREGSMHLRPLVKEALTNVPEAPEMTEPLVEIAAQFSLHPYVNSGGARYFPSLADTEFVLVEDFPEEGAEEGAEVLSILGLKQRSGLSRVEIEAALRQRGGQVMQETLGLDPRTFRLVCVPFNVYLRVGRDRGWGQQQHWTHLDGYQLMERGRLRALVGGDVRYGGLFDLCSISPSDQREGVVARFAIVHRERLLGR